MQNIWTSEQESSKYNGHLNAVFRQLKAILDFVGAIESLEKYK